MKILMLTPYLPYPLLSGGQIRTYNLLKKLSKKHDVTLFALIKNHSERKYLKELNPFCKRIQLFKRSSKPFTLRNILATAFSSFPFLVIRNLVPETIQAVTKELATNEYDLIHAETFYMMPNIPPTTIPVLLVEQTIEYLGYESFANRPPFRWLKPLLNIDIEKIRRWEEHYWQTCTKLITMSEEDRQFILQTIPQREKVDVVSNGVDIGWFSEKPHEDAPQPTILFVGTFNWLPNVEAVEFLVTQIWPLIKDRLPNSKLWIVGNAPTKKIQSFGERDERIEVTGRIPDIRDAFGHADVLVAPVFSGKGTRYKVLEAMAAGTPVVATKLAVEGLGVQEGQHVLTSNTAEGLAQHIVDVIQNPKLKAHLAKHGKEFVTEKYDWTKIADTLDRIYQSLGDTPEAT